MNFYVDISYVVWRATHPVNDQVAGLIAEFGTETASGLLHLTGSNCIIRVRRVHREQ